MKSIKPLYHLFFLSILCTGFIPYSGYAQETELLESEQEPSDNVVRIVRFVGNESIKDQTLKTLIRTQTNREFLGIPRFTPWYYIYQLTNNFGEPPALLDRQQVGTDIERIDRYYQTRGFLDAEVDTNIVEFKENRVEVSFLIDEGNRSNISTITYSGMPSFEQDSTVLNDFFNSGELIEEQIDDSTFQVDKPYMEEQISAERRRIINFLRNNGYAAVQQDSISVQAKRTQSDDYDIELLYRINPGETYTFGNVYINLTGPDRSTNYEEQDTLSGDPYTTGGKTIYLQKKESAQSKFSLLTDQLLFRPGDPFNNDLYLRTINEFQNLGMMNIRQFGLSEDGSQPDYSQTDIPVMFSLETRPKHSVNFNLFGLKRYGYGSGAGVTYTNNNLFGKAENLQISTNSSFEYVRAGTIRDIAPDSETDDSGGRLFRSLEARADYSLPRLTFPFSGLDDNLFFTNSRTRYSLSVSQSNQLLFDINSDVRFNWRYEVNHNDRFSSFLDLLELDVLDTNPSSQFEQSLRDEFGEDSFEYQRILEDFRPQVSSILRYTFRNQDTDLIKRNRGYFSEYSIALGGNAPFLIDKFLVTPGTIEGNLPSPAGVSDNSLAYSRFVKTTADYRQYIPLSDESVFAYRGFAGLAFPYGKSNSIPLNQRFYAGGSNDIRGWDIYSLGPGSVPLEDVTINGGEIKLLAQTEARQTLFQDFLSSDWILTWFTDAGNIWYGPRTDIISSGEESANGENPVETGQTDQREGKFFIDNFYNQIAVGSGLGLRFDWDYVVVRFDFSFRVHDLQEGWFENKKLYFNFGIGHSF